MIDTLKNIIDADKSYMQDEQALEAWTFINYMLYSGLIIEYISCR